MLLNLQAQNAGYHVRAYFRGNGDGCFKLGRIWIYLPWRGGEEGCAKVRNMMALTEKVMNEFNWKIPDHRCDCRCEDGFRSFTYSDGRIGISVNMNSWEQISDSDADSYQNAEDGLVMVLRRLGIKEEITKSLEEDEIDELSRILEKEELGRLGQD